MHRVRNSCYTKETKEMKRAKDDNAHIAEIREHTCKSMMQRMNTGGIVHGEVRQG